MNIGDKLRKRRHELGKTQEWVALELETSLKIKISQPTINNWENGKSGPSIEQLKALAKVLGLSISYLIGDTDKWRRLAEEYADKCKMLEKVNMMLLKENGQSLS